MDNDMDVASNTGLMVPSLKATGSSTWPQDTVDSSIKMAMYTKVNGSTIKHRALELTNT